MTAGAPILPVRQPKQGRSRASLERVIGAATELLREGGHDGLTLNEVSRRAQVSIGSIYARVAGKDELLRVVQARALAAMEAEHMALCASERWADQPLDVLVKGLVAELAEYFRRHAPLLRAFMARAEHDEIIGSAGRAIWGLSAERVQQLILQRRHEIRRPDPERAVAACYTTIYATFGRYLGLGLPAEAAAQGDWETIKEDVGQMCVCFLRCADR